MKVVLSRTYDKEQTFGTLIILDGHEIPYKCKTLELPNLGNQKNISCIPEGSYKVEKYNSPTKGSCFHIIDVPGRESILIHKGNYKKDTLGCILVGEFFEDINRDGMKDIVNSTIAMDRILELLPNKFTLIIL